MLIAISNLLKGAVLGIAMVIPGVSGGTMALVLGIYERLIRALHGFSISTLKEMLRLPCSKDRKTRFTALWAGHDLGFLAQLLGGALLSILACSRLIEYFLESHPNPTNGFFFGLVGASIIFPLRLMERKSIVELACALGAMALTIALATAATGQDQVPGDADASHSLSNCGRFAICGIVASSAMLLPGVSGSFLLLLLGIYHQLIGIINSWDYLLIAVFAAGCLVGLVLFARLINFLLERFHSPTMAFLGGLMAGSLWNLWPFRSPGSNEPAWPGENDSATGMSLLAFLVAAAIIATLALYGRNAGSRGDQPRGEA